MFLAVRISSYGCTWEVWRALKKLELFSVAPRASYASFVLSKLPENQFLGRRIDAKQSPTNLGFSFGVVNCLVVFPIHFNPNNHTLNFTPIQVYPRLKLLGLLLPDLLIKKWTYHTCPPFLRPATQAIAIRTLTTSARAFWGFLKCIFLPSTKNLSQGSFTSFEK